MARILLVEDDSSTANLVKGKLDKQKHVVDLVFDGLTGKELMQLHTYDLLILDWELPACSGVDLVKLFRAGNGNSPILMITGRSSIDDKTTGFNAGVDDYLTKPFDLQEMSLRVQSLLRRPVNLTTPELTCGELSVDTSKHQAWYQGSLVKLKAREFALLEIFIRNQEIVFSSEELKEKLWTFDSEIGDIGVRVLISRLRNKLGQDSSPIKTVYGVGYKMSASNEDE
jgi:DNA-binding response OmpR family regulator